MAIKDWTTNFPTTQDTGTDGADQQATLVISADVTRPSQIHALRGKAQALALAQGDDSNLPAGSIKDILDVSSGDAQQVRFIELAGDPTNVANKGFIYTKDDTAVTQLFFIDSAGTVYQLTPTAHDFAGAEHNASVLSDVNGEISNFSLGDPVTAQASTPLSLSANDSGNLYTEEGSSGGIVVNLPTAVASLQYSFVVQDGNGFTINAASGDTIRIAGSASPAAGNISATTIGNTVKLVAVNAMEWISVASEGTWTVSS